MSQIEEIEDAMLKREVLMKSFDLPSFSFGFPQLDETTQQIEESLHHPT